MRRTRLDVQFIFSGFAIRLRYGTYHSDRPPLSPRLRLVTQLAVAWAVSMRCREIGRQLTARLVQGAQVMKSSGNSLLLGGTLSADISARLDRFATLLLRWNRTLNLIAPRDTDVVWERHINDSLQMVPLLSPGIDRAVDLGTGGGFPGLVLAIATGVQFDLIEADRRKASFLRSAVLETAAPATVHACRIEVAALPPAPVVTARALAPLARLLPLAARFVADGGVCLLLKGGKVDEELTAAERDWEMTVTRTPSRTHPDGVILRVAGLQRRTAP
jgi:16S rRNA (guanine527-N7)-methyltransferase